jgi:hypothetical protein
MRLLEDSYLKVQFKLEESVKAETEEQSHNSTLSLTSAIDGGG